MRALGRHLIIEMFDAHNLNDAELLESALRETVEAIDGTTIFLNTFHSVAPSMRAASSRSSGTDLMAEDRITMAKPVSSQIRITMRNTVFHGVLASHSTGSFPNHTQIPLSSPI